MLNIKKGDWVRIDDLIGKIIEDNSSICKVEIYQSRENSHPDYLIQDIYKEYIQKWTPEPGEWCWFWDEHYTTAILAKFENISNGLFMEHHGNIFEYCEPFIGKLPSNLKDL